MVLKFDKSVFPTQCFFIKLNGSWPILFRYQILHYLYVVWAYFIIVIVGITICYQAWYLVDNIGDIMKVTENCATTFMGFQNFIRLVHMRSNQKLFKRLIDDFLNDIFVKRGTNKKIEKRCTREMIIFRAMSIMLFSLICMYCIIPIFELITDPNAVEKPFPYKMIFPYNANHGFSYILTYIMTSYAGFAVVTTLLAEDSLFGFCISHACAQFRLLQKSIQEIIPIGYANAVSKWGPYNVREELIQREYIQSLKKIIRKHDSIIKFCAVLDEFYSPILLVNFTISSILICVVGFQLVTGKMSPGNFAKLLLYISSALTQLFILCWNGNNLIECSTKTAWSLYSCHWEGGYVDPDHNTIYKKYKAITYPPAGVKFNGMLSLMILRSQKPIKITALKFSVLSLQSFTTILSTSMSYFTLLQTLFENE